MEVPNFEIPIVAAMTPLGPMLLEGILFVVHAGVPMIDFRFSEPSGNRFSAVYDGHGVSFAQHSAEGSFLIHPSGPR